MNSCCSNNIKIYNGSIDNVFFQLIINDGEFTYEESPKRQTDEIVLIKDFCCKNDSVKIFVKINQYDSIFHINCKDFKRIKFISDFRGKIILITEKDEEFWIYD